MRKIVRILLFGAACMGSSHQLVLGQLFDPVAAALNKYCVTCHNDKARTGGLSLQSIDLNAPGRNAETWEKVIRKLRTGAMPPPGLPRPDPAATEALAAYLETTLDRAAASAPNPGHASMHRLNRTEYANAIRDLLALDIDSTALLPPDDESSGFDNIADVLRMSPSLMERYLSASWNISREATGDMNIASATATYRVRPDLSQDQHIEGLPLGTRGGILVNHYFPLDAEYVIKVRLWRNTFDLMRGMEDVHQIELGVDGKRVALITAGGKDEFVRMAQNPGEYGAELDRKLTVRIPVKAGSHSVAAAVIQRSHAEKDDLIKPFLRTTIDGLDITGDPSVDRLSVEGPFAATGSGDTPSREKVFLCRPAAAQGVAQDELPCARRIISALLRRAYRRPIEDRDLETPLSFYQRQRNAKSKFDAGIEAALQFILASPEFLFRFEADPADLAPGSIYRVSDVALASRLSFFLWSRPPDEELLTLASQGKLRERPSLEKQVKRMLADPRAGALVDNFAAQWLFLRNLKNFTPDPENFPDFDDNLRQSMEQETRLFFQSVIREDRSAMDLLTADYTFINERLARHYGIPNVYGNQFRRVTMASPERRGLLGQASILAVTSYPNRTSPVQRGKWVLTNLLGIPPTPPPPNVPPLKENEANATRSLRERMEQHRADAVCAGCHKVMDPIGFALENFDAVGRWRDNDDGSRIDPSGTLYNGTHVDGPAGLQSMLTGQPDVFTGVLTEKLLTYALGRGTQYFDMPAVRGIVREARDREYRFSALVLGIVESTPFQMRIKAASTTAASTQEGLHK